MLCAALLRSSNDFCRERRWLFYRNSSPDGYDGSTVSTNLRTLASYFNHLLRDAYVTNLDFNFPPAADMLQYGIGSDSIHCASTTAIQ